MSSTSWQHPPVTCSSSSNSSSSSTVYYNAQELRQKWKGEHTFHTMHLHTLDAGLISYYPRHIIADKENISYIVEKLRPRAGGYTIQLPPGRQYIMNAPITADLVDDITFIGDCNPFVGKAYIQRCQILLRDSEVALATPPSVTPPPQLPFFNYERCHEEVGLGPFDLFITAGGVTVKSVCGKDPCFDSLCAGTTMVGIVRRNGAITYETVSRGYGNTIEFSKGGLFTPNPASVQLPTAIAGEGFFFLPNTQLRFAADASFEPGHHGKFVGLQIAAPPIWFCGNPTDTIVIERCVITETITFRGPVRMPEPCVCLGLMLIFPTGLVEGFGTAFLGAKCHLGSTGGTVAIYYGTFADSVHAVEIKNGGIGSFFGSSFIGNCLALSSVDGSRAIIEAVFFCNNTYATLACYLSVITSERIAVGFSVGQIAGSYLQSPWFVNNTVAFMCYYVSMITCPNVVGVNNEIPTIIDNEIFTTVESNAVGELSDRESLVLMLPNPRAPSPEQLGCLERGRLGGERPTMRELYDAESQSAVSPCLVAGIVGVTRDFVTGAESVRDVSNESVEARQRVNRLRFFGFPGRCNP